MLHFALIKIIQGIWEDASHLLSINRYGALLISSSVLSLFLSSQRLMVANWETTDFHLGEIERKKDR